jgi:hypothetical protein
MLPLLLLAALQAPEAPPLPSDPDDRCGRSEWVQHYLEIRPTVARQGTTIALMPMQARGPAMPAEPIDCTEDWAVSDPALASVSDDRQSLRIAEDARAGTVLTISYRGGGHIVRRSIRIVGRDELVLTGIRAQSRVEGCDAPAKIGELEFTEDGRFAVTFMPFETYKDYWGRYSFDPATGALAMNVEDGNYRPDGLDLEGSAGVDSKGRLLLDGLYLGQPSGLPPPQGACRYTFG